MKGAPGPAAELPVLVRPERQSWMRCLHDSEREPPRAAASEAGGRGGLEGTRGLPLEGVGSSMPNTDLGARDGEANYRQKP